MMILDMLPLNNSTNLCAQSSGPPPKRHLMVEVKIEDSRGNAAKFRNHKALMLSLCLCCPYFKPGNIKQTTPKRSIFAQTNIIVRY